MYKLDGKIDSINLCVAESDNASNKYKETRDKMQEESIKFLFRNFHSRLDSRETQKKIKELLLSSALIDEMGIIFRVIDKNLKIEQQTGEKGLATHLLAVLLCDELFYSTELWKKMITIIGNPAYSETLETFDNILNRRCVLRRITDVIENYLKSLCQVEDQFYIDVNTLTDYNKLKFFSNIEVSQMILVIHHLLNLKRTTSQYVAEKVFKSFGLSPTFMTFLKLSLRNLSL